MSSDHDFCKNYFTTPNSGNVIAALDIVLIEKPELKFLLTSCFCELSISRT